MRQTCPEGKELDGSSLVTRADVTTDQNEGQNNERPADRQHDEAEEMVQSDREWRSMNVTAS